MMPKLVEMAAAYPDVKFIKANCNKVRCARPALRASQLAASAQQDARVDTGQRVGGAASRAHGCFVGAADATCAVRHRISLRRAPEHAHRLHRCMPPVACG